MAGKKMPVGGRTKAFLVDRVHNRHGALTKREAAEVVDTIFSTLKATLADGKKVQIKNFGVFEVIPRAGRAGVNPSSGESIYIPPHRGLQFRPSCQLKDTVEKDPESAGKKRDDEERDGTDSVRDP